MARLEGEWFNGKPGGSLARRENDWIVRFQNPYSGKCFSDSKFGGRFEAFVAAKDWQARESLARDQTRNMLRVVQENDETYLEVKMQDGRTMKCDIADSALVEERTWSSWKCKTGVDVYYACWSGRGEEAGEKLHKLLCPQWKKVDHINRDGLDNRRQNLRDGGHGANERNAARRADNTSGATGVSYSGDSQSWVVQWSEGGKRRTKRFPGAREDELAKARAIEFRRVANLRTGNTNGLEPAKS